MWSAKDELKQMLICDASLELLATPTATRKIKRLTNNLACSSLTVSISGDVSSYGIFTSILHTRLSFQIDEFKNIKNFFAKSLYIV